MYVCLCNGFTDGCVDRAIDGGANSVAQVYRSLDAIPQCGKCKDTINARLTARSEERTFDPSEGMLVPAE